MSNFSRAAIRQAIVAVLQDGAGTVRTVEQGLFAYADLNPPHPIEKRQAYCRDAARARNYFDVSIGPVRNEPGSPFSQLGSRSIREMPVVIDCYRYVHNRVDDETRSDNFDEFSDQLQTACEALGSIDNLRFAPDGTTPTLLLEGVLFAQFSQSDPEFSSPIVRDWDEHIMQAQILALAVVDLIRAT